MVINAEADKSLGQTTYFPQDVLLVIEVISPESRLRDLKRKPQLYAEAGIPHMWHVDNIDDEPIVHTYELDPLSHTYAPTGVHHNRVKTSVPFDIDIDMTEIFNM